MRETRFFECDNSDELYETLAFAKARSDGGRTVIKLDGTKQYYLPEPSPFGPESRITLDFDGLIAYPEGSGCVLRRPK